jgi:hypothetical protein
MFITLYIKPEDNAEIQRLATEAGISKSRFMVVKSLQKESTFSNLFKPRK